MSTLAANKALIRHVFEDVIPTGDAAAMRDLVSPDFLDHDPLPGQPAGGAGAEYVVSTMHTAHPDLRFSIDDLVAEDDRVTIRWTLRGNQQRPAVRSASHRSAGRAGGDRDLPRQQRQDHGALGGMEAASARSGSVTRNVVPAPGMLSSATLPPCAWTMAATIASPRPAPPWSRAREGSPR